MKFKLRNPQSPLGKAVSEEMEAARQSEIPNMARVIAELSTRSDSKQAYLDGFQDSLEMLARCVGEDDASSFAVKCVAISLLEAVSLARRSEEL